MQLHPTGTDPTSLALLVCRNARWNLIVLLTVFWGAAIGWWYVEAPTWVVGMCASVALLLTWPLLGAWRKRGRRDNWVLAVHRDGVWLNLRDAEYHEAEPGLTVVYLPNGDIQSARRVVHRYTVPSGTNETTYHKDVFLELKIPPDAVAQLRSEIVAERRRELPEKKHFGGKVTTRTRRSHMAIEAEADDSIRIKFSGSSIGLKPGIKRTLATLGKFVPINVDYQGRTENWRNLDECQVDELVRRLVASGQTMDASELLMHRKGMNLTEARQFIDELRGKQGQTAKRPL
jgi:hypothetical protein